MLVIWSTVYLWRRGCMELSTLSPQLFCKLKTVLKKTLLLKTEKVYHENDSSSIMGFAHILNQPQLLPLGLTVMHYRLTGSRTPSLIMLPLCFPWSGRRGVFSGLGGRPGQVRLGGTFCRAVIQERFPSCGRTLESTWPQPSLFWASWSAGLCA